MFYLLSLLKISFFVFYFVTNFVALVILKSFIIHSYNVPISFLFTLDSVMIAFVQDPDVTFFAQVNFMKTEVIYLRLNPRIKEAVNLKALDEGKSVNLYLQDLICKELEDRS